MKKRQIISLGLAASILIFSGCQKSPENSIVKNKDFDKMVDQAQDVENSVTSVADMTEYDTYQDSFSDEGLGVTVTADAKVDIPKTDQMSVFRIRQKEISQEFLDQVKDAAMPGVTLYDASKLDTPTKSSIEEEIRSEKLAIEELEAEAAAGNMDQESVEIQKEEIQREIDKLQEDYEKAPLEIDLSDYPLDGKMNKVADLLAQDPNSDYYQWQKDLNPNGSVYNGAGKGEDGLYHVLYAQNNENYGNYLRYVTRSNSYPSMNSVIAASPIVRGHERGSIWKTSEDPKTRIDIETGWNEAQEVEDEPLNISQEEAQEKADTFLNTLGLKEYSLYDGDEYCQYLNIEDEILKYRKIYIFQYLRNIDGVYVNNEGMSKYSDGWQGENFVKKMWQGESVVVYVNDSGITEFYDICPIEILETVVEKTGMKSFDEIKDIFKQMVIVANASEVSSTDIKVDRVVLRYTRISEADSFDTGLLVPVWDFEGTISSAYDEKEGPYTGSLLTINAIDGSVIDKTLGY